MRIQFKSRSEEGALLFISVMVLLLVSILLVSYFTLVQNQNVSVFRSQARNSAIALAEAGVEEAMQMLNQYSNTGTDPRNWVYTTTNNGWDCLGTGIFHVKRFINSNYYEVYITNTIPNPTIKAIGMPAWTYSFSGQAATTYDTNLARGILITAASSGGYLAAILSKGGISLSGGMVVNSYNSQDPTLSTNGRFDPSKFRDNGDIATIESNVVAAITDTGGATVYGHVATGPGSTVSTTGTAAMGSKSWVDGGSRGVQPGWSRSDMNVAIPDKQVPALSLAPWPSAGSYSYGGTNYTYLLRDGAYLAPSGFSISGQGSMAVVGNVIIVASNGFSLSGQSFVYIATNANLTAYMGGSVSLTGQGVANSTSFATNFTYIGLPSNTSISMSGNSAFNGTIYAPEADISFSGGGNNTVDFMGAIVGKSVRISGKYQFHYDESLGSGSNGSDYYYATSWREVSAWQEAGL